MDNSVKKNMENNMENEAFNCRKLPYEPPVLALYDYLLETGFAGSIDMGRHMEEISHYTNEEGQSEKGGWY